MRETSLTQPDDNKAAHRQPLASLLWSVFACRPIETNSMSIFPLPQFETDLKEHLLEEDRKTYERLKAPTAIVVRFGAMKLVGEFPYDGEAKPGCGSKLVVRTHRGTELGEMLTSTCPNSGCSKSVSRQDMLKYIENSGGRDYPFFNNGKVLRIATKEDLDAQARLEQSKHALKMDARRRAERFKSTARFVDAEPILGGERLTFYYYSEERLDVHLIHEDLQKAHPNTRIELKMVGARDEARLIADYEKCGQYCCCKNFLKVLKPVSMKSAKVQKATLDPLKISGRCGRLMCCLRYEDQTYEELAKRLPRKKSRVGTPEGDGIVIDAQILTQLVLVLLDNSDKRVAVPVEEITPPESAVAPPPPPMPPPRAPREARPADRPPARSQDRPERPTERSAERASGRDPARGQDAPRPSRHEARRDDRPRPPREPDPSMVDFDDIPTDAGDGPDRQGRPHPAAGQDTPESREGGSGEGRRKRRRRRRGGSGGSSSGGGGAGGGGGGGESGGTAPRPENQSQRPSQRPDRPPQDRRPQDGPMGELQPGGPEGGPRKKRRRRKRRPGGGPGGGAGGGEGAGPSGNPAGDGNA